MISSVRLHQVVLAAALAVPGVLFGVAAWENRRDVTREGWGAIDHAVRQVGRAGMSGW